MGFACEEKQSKNNIHNTSNGCPFGMQVKKVTNFITKRDLIPPFNPPNGFWKRSQSKMKNQKFDTEKVKSSNGYTRKPEWWSITNQQCDNEQWLKRGKTSKHNLKPTWKFSGHHKTAYSSLHTNKKWTCVRNCIRWRNKIEQKSQNQNENRRSGAHK